MKPLSIFFLAAAVLPLAGCHIRKNHSGERENSIFFSWDQPVSDDTTMLSSQMFTSFDKLLDAFDNGTAGDYLNEPTLAAEAFFKRETDIKNTQLARTVQMRYNYVALLGRVMNAYEWFGRESSGVESEDERFTIQDTLAWIKESQPKLDPQFVTNALLLPGSGEAAMRLLNAYRQYDGSDSEDSEFANALKNCRNEFAKVPDIVSEEELNMFESEFWDWYDKGQFVHGIDTLIRMNTYKYDGKKLSEEQIPLLANATKREKNLDERTILALELVKFDQKEGVILLGDILESGMYTRYLLEAWISWRANAQSINSPSSFSVIPNNYYDMVRVKCLNAFLRHLQEEPDDYKAKCLMENMILCEDLHRMATIAGNESFKTRMLLAYSYFIPKRLIQD